MAKAILESEPELRLDGTGELTPAGVEALNAAFRSTSRSARPTPTAGYAVEYVFGSGIPEIVCAPTRVCVIELEPEERVLEGGLHLGDTSRWSVSPLLGAQARTQLVIKPFDTDITTNMSIHTNQRTYIINLVAHPEHSVPLMRFSYPEATMAEAGDAWRAYHESSRQEMALAAVSEMAESVSAETIDFRYEVGDCNCGFRPERVFNDGARTYIDLSDGYGGDLPLLSVEGGMAARWNGKRLIADGLFEEATLALQGKEVRIKWKFDQ